MKLQEYREQETDEFIDSYKPVEYCEVSWQTVNEVFNAGFDKALELDPPIKFAEWTKGTMSPNGKDIIRANPDNYWKELYEYWLQNVYEI